MTHTPGSWKPIETPVKSLTCSDWYSARIGCEDINVSWCPATAHGETAEECTDNAVLIAAAPDMLAGLREAIRVMERNPVEPCVIARARGAIAKATNTTREQGS